MLCYLKPLELYLLNVKYFKEVKGYNMDIVDEAVAETELPRDGTLELREHHVLNYFSKKVMGRFLARREDHRVKNPTIILKSIFWEDW